MTSLYGMFSSPHLLRPISRDPPLRGYEVAVQSHTFL